MGERYWAPIALIRMNRGWCPECGVKPENHDTALGSWARPALVTDCPLTPTQVQERLDQYNKDLKQSEEESSESEIESEQPSAVPQS